VSIRSKQYVTSNWPALESAISSQHMYCKTLIIRAHLIFAKFTNSLKSRN